ncbi:MAG: lysophospholipid acyltransferase family protein [Flavobacteriales bacterium]|nr:lysophospholipid acyltransferase family protein [Flavobacteriales bacterium]
MKKLIPDEAIASATRLPKDNLIVTLLTRVARIDEVNDLYDKVCNSQGLETIDELFRQLDLEIELDEKLLENIPAQGAFIVAANHPFGALDGLTMLYAIAKKRPDFKVMANFLLQNVEPIKDYFVSVNPFESRKEVYSNVTGLKAVMQHLENGHPLGMFPAGEVSTFQGDFRTIADKKWANSALKIIRNAGVPVVPVYFDGTNSRIFHLLGLIHANLRTLALPSEMLKKKGKVIRMKIGKPIQPKDTEMFTNLDQFGRYIRAKTYALGSSFDVKRDYFKVFRIQKKADDIIPPVPEAEILREINAIQDFRTLSYDNFDCYVVGSSHIPSILREIGRLREVTFREVGEGTNHSIDLDEYDLYYNHLILWDRDAKKIAGAYRVGNGYQIMNTYGRKGFYISSLFRISPQLDTMLSQSLELGRSFIIKEYQRHRLSLFLLWKGILYYLLSNQQFRYIIGPVSISNQYQDVSKELIIEFITKNYFDHVLAEMVQPRNAFKPKVTNVDTTALVESSQADLKKMDRIISEIEPTAFTMPVLLKKYLQQNAKIIAFNCDPKFNNALDGLMYLDLMNLPADTVETLQREMVANQS